MLRIEAQTFAVAYYELCDEILDNYEYETSPRGLKIRESLNTTIKVNDPLSNIFSCDERPFPKKYLAGELIWYFSGDNSLEGIQKYSKFWGKITNKDGTLNSAYGHLIFKERNEHGLNQWSWALQSLIQDKDSRQAIMHFNMPHHQQLGIKDFVCTLNVQFFIRENKLNMITNMRSGDLIRGLTFDFPWFSLLQQQMFRHLKKHYQDLELGWYQHNTGSSHIYSEHFEKVEKMLVAGIEPDSIPALDGDFVDEQGNPTDFLNSNHALALWIREHS